MRAGPCWGVLAVLLANVIAGCAGIRCYECVHNSQRTKRQQRYVYPCADFDGSDHFIRDCPDSSLCIYQHITLRLSHGAVTVHTMDGCTPNSTRLDRYREAGLVEEGCIQHISRYKAPSSVYCYCGADLCNGRAGADQVKGAGMLMGGTVLLLLLRHAAGLPVA